MQISKTADLTGHKGGIYCLDSNETSIFTGGSDRLLCEWQLNDPNGTAIAQCNSPIYALTTLPNNQLAFALGSGEVKIIDLSTREELLFYNIHNAAVYTLVWNNGCLFSADINGFIGIYDLENTKTVFYNQVFKGKIRKLTIHKNSLYVCGFNGNIKLFNLETMGLILEKNLHELNLNGIYIGNKEMVSYSRDGRIKIWDTDFNLLKNIPAHNFAIYGLSNNNNGLWASCSRDKSIKIWDAEFNFIAKLNAENYAAHNYSVNAIKWINTTILASVSDDGKLMLWEIH